MSQIYYAILLERALLEPAADAFFDVCAHGGAFGYKRIRVPYARTDQARNKLVEIFRATPGAPDDKLIMLDADHRHPADTLEHLVVHDVGVVGALYFRRGDDFRPCFFLRDGEGLSIPMSWPDKALIPVAIVGTGAIAIKRWVFDKLEERGFDPPFFQYVYDYYPDHPTEDMYFGEICERAGIPHHVDTSLVSRHLTWSEIDETRWQAWVKANQDKFTPMETQNGRDETYGRDAGGKEPQATKAAL